MKPKNIDKKLSLGKKTIVNLGTDHMNGLKGGSGDTIEVCCYTKTCTATCETDCNQYTCPIICPEFCTFERTTCVN